MVILNKDQRIILSEFLIALSVAWLSVGAISPLFDPVENVLQLVYRILVSTLVSFMLLVFAIRNVGRRRRRYV